MSPEQQGYQTRVVLDSKAQEESQKRYEHIQYRNLILKSALTFALGMLLSFFPKGL